MDKKDNFKQEKEKAAIPRPRLCYCLFVQQVSLKLLNCYN